MTHGSSLGRAFAIAFLLADLFLGRKRVSCQEYYKPSFCPYTLPEICRWFLYRKPLGSKESLFLTSVRRT